MTWTEVSLSTTTWSDYDNTGPAYDGSASYNGSSQYGAKITSTTWTTQSESSTTWTES